MLPLVGSHCGTLTITGERRRMPFQNRLLSVAYNVAPPTESSTVFATRFFLHLLEMESLAFEALQVISLLMRIFHFYSVIDDVTDAVDGKERVHTQTPRHKSLPTKKTGNN
ncbi:unnamed protein product [Caenorhabditis auriculariae]|uniref:Uncharacterized protein n=1 Tax=Caenorhabditis auriculariae TaxID=2777116 RepID=A0A8S1GTA3_9PELO|nr:unnamed protein product [Caenorhabditis auriculariae]